VLKRFFVLQTSAPQYQYTRKWHAFTDICTVQYRQHTMSYKYKLNKGTQQFLKLLNAPKKGPVVELTLEDQRKNYLAILSEQLLYVKVSLSQLSKIMYIATISIKTIV